MMRKVLPFVLFVSLILLPCCKGGAQKGDASSDSLEHAPSAAAEAAISPAPVSFRTDSFKYSLTGKMGRCDVYLDYPVEGPQQVVSSVREWMKSTMFENGTSTMTDDPMQLVRAYCKERQAVLSKTLEQMDIASVSKDDAPEEGIEIRLVCSNDRFVTYEVYRYSYITHGAHGEYSDYGTTFSMADGHRLGNVVREMDEQLFVHVREGLKSYFEITSDEQLEAICTADLSLMPMPTFPPYLVRDGVRFHYSIYDVCPFDWGDPVLTIPYDVVRPYLTQEALDVIGSKKP